MTAQPVSQRVARYAKRQKERGVVRVTVYVPKKDAAKIYKLAAKLRE